MRTALAERLLIKVMNWSIEEVTIERPLIQAMAKLKYDEYQQFSPGIRFTESLAQWLSQFNEDERKVAYNFIKSNLIFISNQQIVHLVSICFAEKINPLLLAKAAKQKNELPYRVRKIYNSKEYQEIKRRSLFLGISDGAKIDLLRRTSGISNEQVFSSYYISSEKKDDLLRELQKDEYPGKFNSVYLIDDFTGSGLSYARIEDGKQTGKVIKFLNLVFDLDPTTRDSLVLPELLNKENLDFHIIFYVARKASVEYLQEQIENWRITNHIQFNFTIDAIQFIGENFKEEMLTNSNLVSLSKSYIKKAIIDRHFIKGKHERYYLGFDECALPLILHHNTPNNALPLLWWYPEDETFRGLFPRITRHRE